MAGRGRKKYYAVRVGFKPGLYTEWSEAEKQVIGYNGAEYCSFKLKREADKYLKTKKKKEQQKTDAQKNNWQRITYSRQRKRNLAANYQTNSAETSTKNRFNLLQEYSAQNEDEEEELTEGRLSDFFASQRSTHRNSDRRQPQRRASKFKRRRKTVIIGDSQLKYIRGENLSTRDTYVEVNSASGAKVQQVPDLFSQELEDPTVSQ